MLLQEGRNKVLYTHVPAYSYHTRRIDQLRDQMVELFLEGVRLAMAASPVSVTLSGGADSRCLLAASLHLGRETATYSTGVPGSRAIDYARRMAALSSVPCTFRLLDQQFVVALDGLMQRRMMSCRA